MCDLIYGTSLDCNTNSIPDECEFADCNQNCIPDESDIASETSPDCNDNFVPDECDIVSGYSHDNTANGIPDDCENLELVGFEAALVTRANRPAVGATGYLEDLNATPVINNNRIVALWATTTQGQEILYTWSRDEGLLPQVRQGDESPIIGVTFDMIWKPLSINDSSEVAFSAELSAAPGRGVFVVSDAAVDTIAVQGDLVSDLGGVVDFGFNETDSGQASAPVGAAILSTGDVVFRGNLNGAANGLGQSGAIFLHSGGLITALAASGMSVPTLGIIDVIQQGPWASPDGVVTFRARANGIDRILRYYNGELHVIARTGNCAPGTPTVFMQFDDPVTSAGPVETYFSATISGFPGNGIFKRRFDGTINDLVVEGDPTPVGGSFIRPRSVLGNPLGNLFYYSEISGAGPASGIFTYTQRTTTSAAVLLAGADAPAAGGLEVDDPGSFAINSVGDMVVQYKATDGFRRIVLLDRHLVGDLDLDDDVDIVDFDTFVECMAGPGVTGGALCIEADFDGDADIDMDDFGVMQDAFIICEQSGADCNGNGVGDECDLEGEIATDCDDNGVLDECDILLGFAIDCNSNLLNDSCDITTGSSVDFNANAVPDECEGFEDCNLNAIGDQFDLSMGTSLDCDGNLEPDECQLLDGPPVLVGADAGTVVRIRPTDPAESHIANIGIPDIRGMAASCDSTIWAVSSSGDVGTIDPLLGTFSFLAANPLFIWDAAAFDCATGILYAKATVSPGMENTLYRISTIDGSPEPVGYIGAIRGLAFDSLNNTLYGFGNGILYEIDPETGCSNILCDNLISSALQTLAFGDGHLYVTSTSTVYEIAPTTCNATAIGTIGSPLDSTTALTYTYDTSDCNDNGIPDNCDLDSGTSEDLNGDSVPDECEGADCNANNVPDVQELLLQISLMSEVFSPFGHGFPANYTIPASPFTTGSVAFRYDVLADLGSPDESVDISIAGPEGAFARSDVWQTTGVNCPVGGGWLVDDVSGTVFNENIAGADTAITVTASATVDPFECVDDTFLKITIQYVADNDCNENGIPDECDIQFGGSTDCEPNGIPDDCEPDCNGNLVADLCDILNGTSVDCQGNGIPDECETDCNGNAIDDSCDIATGTSDDCNLNDVPDECESDCNANGIADSCDIAIGPSEDCNVNTVPDECDIMDGTSEDADGSGVPDECEVPPPMLLWADVWGQRIERVFLDGLQRVEITQTKVPRGLLVHPESLKLYWTENAEGGMLARVNLDGTGMQTLATNLTTNLDGLALDVQSQRLFFCDSLSGGAGAILSIALNGTDLQTVLGNQEEPKDIQIPQGGGKMYWLADDREFRRASLDGSAEELMFSVTGSVRKFALDVADNRIYWTTGGSLMRSQLDGTQQEVVIGFGVPDGVTLDSGAARLYWSDFDDTKIRRATLSGQAIEEFVTMGIERALILRLYPENGSAFEDCNANNIPDATDIANATSEDCNTNLVPDECEVDCSGNQIPDECDIQSGVEQDCNGNDVPDSCDLESGTSHDDDGSGVPDECEGDLDPNLSYSYAKIGPAGAAAIAINDSGHVAYWSDDGLHIQTDTEDILKVGSAGFDTIGTNTIRLSNADHVVLFGRRDSSSEFELLRVEPSQVAADIAEFTVVADASGFPFTSIARIGGVPASGEVPFGADGPPVATTFVGDGSGDIHNIDSFAQPFPDTLFGPVSSTIPPLLNENELIVTAFDVASIPAIIGLQGALPPDPTINDYIIFNLFSETGYGVPRAMAVGNSGKVAFVSANPPRDLVLADGAVQEILATDVSGAQVIDINSNDEVLFFRGDIGSGGTSLILTDGLVEVPVLTASDEVDGLTVIGIELPQRSINDARQVLLNLLYDEGNGVERAAYLATPNP